MEEHSCSNDSALTTKDSDTDANSVTNIFRHILTRKTGIIRALTIEFDQLFEKCDPHEHDLCLYGLPDGGWEVKPAPQEVPSELPEPAAGINEARDGMEREDWLKFIALHSDGWMLSLASFYAAELQKDDRKRLFCMLSDVPTVYDFITGKAPLVDVNGNRIEFNGEIQIQQIHYREDIMEYEVVTSGSDSNSTVSEGSPEGQVELNRNE